MALKKLSAYLFFILISFGVYAQNDGGFAEFQSFWSKTDSEFKNPDKSPLTKSQMNSFDSIPRYEYKPDFRVKAKWVPVKKSKPFYFDTTGKIKQKYIQVGRAQFKLMGKSLELAVYKNIELSRMDGYEDYLFIPYTDDTNGLETYGGGKYVSMHAEPKDSLIIDFNQSYNPYCAYNNAYSCPIPPEENFLDIAIPAGARSDH